MRSRMPLRAWAIRSSNFTGLVSNKAAWQSCRQSGRKCVCLLVIFSFYRTTAASASTPLFVSDYIAYWTLWQASYEVVTQSPHFAELITKPRSLHMVGEKSCSQQPWGPDHRHLIFGKADISSPVPTLWRLRRRSLCHKTCLIVFGQFCSLPYFFRSSVAMLKKSSTARKQLKPSLTAKNSRTVTRALTIGTRATRGSTQVNGKRLQAIGVALRIIRNQTA